MSPFHNRFECFGKFLCLILLHLVTSYFSNLGLIYKFFRFGSDFGRTKKVFSEVF
ncbi:unnamed protein product [Brassica rapa]|uniref:Uncharacterized protein n=1 Tax=Brassica campestris TaxID=3711 RepID=A0A8D9LSU6_BRACM|nr:unnamed protein product [Brassica rapa]